ncbi:MAG: methionine adenosyltransferase [Metamycoplasmataceae bacterium]
MKYYFTSESVGVGHPDKICDQISDSILDKILKKDPTAKVAVEVMASNRLIIVGGEITTTTYVDITATTWEILFKLGYNENDFTILSNVNSQSTEILHSVEHSDGSIGAGDQGIIFGYATNETKEFMPITLVIAHKLNKLTESLIRSGELSFLKFDMKSQVTISYNESGKEIDTILMSIQHNENVSKKTIEEKVTKLVIEPIINEYLPTKKYKIIINPSGSFTIGGPIGDTGLTGRKIIVDTYGGAARHGGGAFSGKDPTKVDRSAAYAARWVAKNLVAAKIADKIELQISYGIGIVKPISIFVETFGTEKISKEKIEKIIQKVFDLTPGGIIRDLDLRKPIYLQTATYGHFGRTDINLPWEKTNKVKEILKIKDKLK